ncbi:MAG: hypothetical protein IJ711_01355 [Lachnospiraceae bacterium]|nr:hypothetical protein [Lachnospiraceae bacterium]
MSYETMFVYLLKITTQCAKIPIKMFWKKWEEISKVESRVGACEISAAE